MKYGNIMQNSMLITVMWSKSNQKNFNMADVCFFAKRKQLYLGCGLSYPDDIWHADRPSEESDITRSDVEVKLSTATIILKIDKTSYLRRE